MLAHTRETANQIREEYVDTLSKIYYSYFKDYYNKLMKLQVTEREREREAEREKERQRERKRERMEEERKRVRVKYGWEEALKTVN